MKNLCLLILFTLCHTVEVTFNLDMSQEVISEEGIYLAGGGTFGAPGDNPMDDDDGDGIYSITVTLPENSGTDYTFSNGICNATTFSCKENIVGQDCAVPPWNDRHIDVGTEDVTVNACFGLCGDGSCDDIDPLETVDVTFNLDMSSVETSSSGVYIAGGGFFGVPGDYPMIDDDGDDVWTITVSVPTNTGIDYTFANGACSDFGCKENITNQECAVPPYDDRYLEIGTENITVNACFALCGDGFCDSLEPLATANITFRVNMSIVETNPEGVYLAGGDMGQEGYLMYDSDGDDIWEITIPLIINNRYLYKFRNQPSYGTWNGFEPIEGLIEGGCATGDYADRYIDVENSDIVLDIVDYGSCYSDPCVDVFCWTGQICEDGDCVPDPCNDILCEDGEVCEDGECLEVLPVVTLNVDMNCTSIDFFNVYVNGPVVSGWCGDCMPLSDIDGDGIWSITFESPPGELEYKYTLDGWDHQEDLVDDMVNGGICAPMTDYIGYANRVITVTEDGAISNDSYGSCDECTGSPTGPVNVTFQVDMRYQDPSSGVYLSGGTLGAMADPATPSMGYLMMDLDGDLIFETSLELDANSHYNYKFRTGESFNWEGNWENVPSECGEGQYTDRFIDTDSSDMIFDPVCFASCETCESNQQYTNVTFQVDMSGIEISSDGIFLHANWFSWGEIEMTDYNGDCIYEITMEVLSGSNGEYIFKNGTENEQVPGECDNVNNWGGGVNRLITMPDEDTLLEPICYEQCEGVTCEGECDNLENKDFTKLPVSFELLDPYPNPFNPIVSFMYSVNNKSNVTINIYDINGDIVEKLVDSNHSIGYYNLSWDASNKPSGLYFIKLENDKSILNTKKIILIK